MKRPKVRKALGRQVYVSTAQVAEVLGWDVRRARRWLERECALIKIGRQYFTTPSRLKMAFPEVLEALDLSGRDSQ